MGKKYPCDECVYQATEKGHLTIHKQSVYTGKTYPCGDCHFQAKFKRSLTKQQQSVHMGKKYQAKQKDNFKKHEEKNKQCNNELIKLQLHSCCSTKLY